MILDYSYNKYARNFDISYINEKGAKQILSFNVNHFKAYYSTPAGQFTNWDGSKCDVKWVDEPSKFEIKTFLTELDESYHKILNGKTFPKLYTFDIETMADENGDFSPAEEARCPITTISICSPELNTIVLGTQQFTEQENKVLSENFEEYINNVEFFKKLGIKMPYVKYVYFQTEEEMLKYFLVSIVAKVPILAGWNSIKYDWNYIVNRIKNFYPNLSIKMSSCSRKTRNKSFEDRFGNKFTLPIPEHTLIMDMMDVIESRDKKVLPMKESMKLDYIADASMGIHKIEYTKSLDDLFRNDYGRYVFYNSIDSVLVQLINYRFKALDSVYLIALYCNEKIDNCFGNIVITEDLVFNDFYQHGLKVVYEEHSPVRGKLVGAYVKKSVPGIHEYVCCNDFASLYPSTIRTCNLSFENYVGAFWDEEKLAPFRQEPGKYLVIGPNVFENEKTIKEPKAGRMLYTFLDEKGLAPYRNNKNYFITVNGCVYKNDQDYAFRRIQSNLQVTRNHSKYLGKDLDAQCLEDILLVLNCHKIEKYKQYSEDVKEVIKNLGYDFTCTQDVINTDKEVLKNAKQSIESEVIYFDSNQKAMKDIMNSMYGGTSHISFYWYNMNIANDITGEARNLIHMMEHHIPDYIAKHWPEMHELHHKLGITVRKEHCEEVLKKAYYVPSNVDPDAYNHPSFVIPVYGDTDSLYLCYHELVKTIDGYENLTIPQIRDILVAFNTVFLDKHNREFISNYYETRYGKSVHNFELETLNYAGIWENVKKKYAQLLLWHDKKVYDFDNMEMKNVGLEMKKPSYPKLSRKILSEVVTYLLKNADDKDVIYKLNAKIGELKIVWNHAQIDDICANMSVNGYTKYIESDSDPKGLIVAPKCPSNVRAMANYNWIRNVHNIKAEGLYHGKMKMYKFLRGREWDYFAYPAMEYPEWATKFAPIDRNKMFQDYVIEPLNRIIQPAGLPAINADGSLQFTLELF